MLIAYLRKLLNHISDYYVLIKLVDCMVLTSSLFSQLNAGV